MQEHTVTAGGETYRLDEPFFVLATQNPVEQDGTYPLPEAQTDRFMFKLVVEFPSISELNAIVEMTQTTMDEVACGILDGESLLKMRATAQEIPIMEEILTYTSKLVSATHPELESSPEISKKLIRFGASPRAAQALITAAKVRALMSGRYNVSYDDINTLAYPVLRHRIKGSFEAVTERMTNDKIISLLIDELNGKKTVIASETPAGKPKKMRK